MKQVPQKVKEAAYKLLTNSDLEIALTHCIEAITTEMLHTYDEATILTLHKQVTGLSTLPSRLKALTNA